MQKRPHGATPLRGKITAVRVEIPLADFNVFDNTYFLLQGNRPSLWTGAVSPPGVNERSEAETTCARRDTTGLLTEEAESSVFLFAGEPFKPLNGGGQPSRCERAER